MQTRLRHAKVEYLMKGYTNYIIIQIHKLLYRQIPPILTFAVWEVYVNLTILFLECRKYQQYTGIIFYSISESLNQIISL